MNQTIVSVIMPVLNTKPYLRQCLDSLFSQTLHEMEIICVDNGSTDGSYELLQEFALTHPNMTLLQHTEGRQGGARNAGIERATGEYIGFVDSDDIVAPTMFQSMYDTAKAENADMAICNIELFYEDNQSPRLHLPADLLAGGEVISIQQRPRLLRNLTICNKIFRRDFIYNHHIRFPVGIFHEDQFFVITAFLSSERIVTESEALYFYRRGRPGSVNEYRGSDSMHIFHVMQTVSDFIETKGMDKSVKMLVDEVKTQRYLSLYSTTNNTSRREYFERMRKEFQHLDISTKPQMLTPSELREFEIVRRHGYTAYNLFLEVRDIYGRGLGKIRTRSAPLTKEKVHALIERRE